MTAKLFPVFSLRSTSRVVVLLAALALMQSAFATQEASTQQGQIVVSAFPEARQALAPDSSWVSAGNSNFTGNVVMKSAFRQLSPARSYGAYVRFSQGARTYWHMHPLGQTLLVVDGIGLTQARNPDGSLGPVVSVKAGDVVTCPPGIMHWHGASPDSPMTHLAISESDSKQPVVWMEPVDDKSYRDGAVKALRNR